MSREIKFRGISESTNKMVYGDLVINRPTDSYRIVENFALVCDPIEYKGSELVGCSGVFHNVHKKTVGEFTGLTDKNGTGKEVYESDIFEVVYSNVPNGFEAMNFKKELKINVGEVVFKFGGFKIKTFHPDRKEYVYMDLHTFLKNDEKVVIGNVHQNPELLAS